MGSETNFCGRGSMVERDLAKVETRVRFSSPAPFKKPFHTEGLFDLSKFYYLHIHNKQDKQA